MMLLMSVTSPTLTIKFSSVPKRITKSISALTERMIQAMHEDEARLGVLPPSHEPRATGHIDDIVAMVETLIKKDFAYAAANGDVYYRVRKFADYGKRQ